MFKKDMYTRLILILNVIVFIMIMYINNPLSHEKVDGLISNLFKVSAFLITLIMSYIFTKIFRLRSEREERKKEIDKIAYKITEFRRFLYHLLQCKIFWGDYTDIDKLNIHYKGFTYNQLHSENHNDEKINYYCSKEKRFSTTKANIYLASKELVGYSRDIEWVVNKNVEIEYSQEKLDDFYYPITVYWYYFSHKWHGYTKGLFNFYEASYQFDEMRPYLSSIHEKFENQALDENLIANVGTEMYEQWGKIYELTRINNGKLPKSIRRLINIIILITIFGVLMPLLVSVGNLEFPIDVRICLVSVCVLAGCLIWILFDIYSIINDEIKV